MNISDDVDWINDLHEFISHWEHEVESIEDRQLDERECNIIAERFQKDKDILLCRRPVGVSDEQITRLEPLTSRLNVSLAQALCNVKLDNQSEF